MPDISSKKKRNPLKLSTLFIIVLLILLFGSHVLLQDTKSPTPQRISAFAPIHKTQIPLNLSTFTIPGLISFEYPSNYPILYNTNGTQSVIQITFPSNEGFSTPIQLSIAINALSQNESLMDFISQHPICERATTKPPIPVYINQSISGMAVLDINCASGITSGIYTTNNSNAYRLTISANATYGQIKSFIAPILSSLQF